MYCLYRHTNKLNGKSYIGLTSKSVDTRWQEHLTEASTQASSTYHTKFKRALRKYGADMFEHELLETVDTKEEAMVQEQWWIALYNTYYEGYNLTHGGDYFTPTGENHQYFGKSVIDENGAREKIQEILRNNNPAKRPEVRKKLSKYLTVNNPMRSPETVERMRQSKIGSKASEETKRKMSLSRIGKTFEIATCPWCHKTGKESGLKSWHFDYCKENPNQIKRG